MTNDDIKKLAWALQHRENKNEARIQINKVFRNKKCKTIIKELKTYMSANKGNDSNRALLIVVMAILYKNSDLLCELQQVLAAEGLIQNLYGAMCIVLNGKSSLFKIEIEWTDSHFPNKYDYLNRFFGEFAWEQTREILYAAKIIAMSDKVRFEELAYKDKTRLILLNVLSYRLDINEKMSDTLITKLMRDGDDLQANIGFYHAVRDITNDIRDYAQLRNNAQQNNDPIFPNMKTKQEIDKNIVSHLNAFFNIYNHCTDERKASLLVNYILTEREYPIQFGYWLMEASLQQALIFEITSSGKITNLDKLLTITSLIHDFPCKNDNGASVKKDKLYAAVVSVLKRFISERKGVFTWDERQEEIFLNIVAALPKRFCKQLYNYLEKESKKLMVSKLDEMVRFSIYLEDKRQWDVCQGMMMCLRNSG